MARLTGHFGSVYVQTDNSGSFVKVADVFDWQFSADVTLLDASIKGDFIERFVSSHASGVKFTAKRRHEGLSVFNFYVADAANNNLMSSWRLDLIDGNSGFTQISGAGLARSTSTSAPTDGAEETIEIAFDSYTFNN